MEPKPINNNGPPMNFEEARAFLKVSKPTMYRYTSRGLVRFFKPNGRTLYFRRADLEEFVFGASVQPASGGQS